MEVVVRCDEDENSAIPCDSQREACKGYEIDLVANVTKGICRNGTLTSQNEPEFERVGLFCLLLCFCLATVLGNVLVVLAVLRESSLHSATNYFITSLAVADCLVGLVVMPFSAIQEAMDGKWIFGADVCDLWHSLDVLASTASILNLCVISLDRYWAILNPVRRAECDASPLRGYEGEGKIVASKFVRKGQKGMQIWLACKS